MSSSTFLQSIGGIVATRYINMSAENSPGLVVAMSVWIHAQRVIHWCKTSFYIEFGKMLTYLSNNWRESTTGKKSGGVIDVYLLVQVGIAFPCTRHSRNSFLVGHAVLCGEKHFSLVVS